MIGRSLPAGPVRKARPPMI